MANYPTPHIECKDPTMIAKTVLMPGDPLRAKFIADTFLTDVVKFNNVRGMNGFTGTYKGQRISVMGSGMGMPSIGIYSYELFAFYGVERIVRIGSAGSYSGRLDVYDTVLVTGAYSESTYAREAHGIEGDTIAANPKLLDLIRTCAAETGIEVKEAICHSSDIFYRSTNFSWENCRDTHKCECVEMESFALFANAQKLGKEAACLLTISDSFVTHEATTAEERQNSFTNMMKVALQLALHE